MKKNNADSFLYMLKSVNKTFTISCCTLHIAECGPGAQYRKTRPKGKENSTTCNSHIPSY